jgi:DNA-binding NtrC family response regulator
MLCLVINQGQSRREIPLPAEGERIGSASDNEIVLRMAGVSRHHAEVTCTAEGLALRDLGSKNGILLDGARVPSAPLVPGVRLEIGAALLSVEELSTSDMLAGLRIDGRPGESRPGCPAAATAEITAAQNYGPAAAFALVRELEARGWFPESAVDDVLRVLNASTVVIGAVTDEGLAVVALAGAVPSESDLQSLLTRSALGDSEWHTVIASRYLIAARTAESAPWKNEFLQFLGTRLAEPKPATNTRPLRGLVIPEGMIIGQSIAMRDVLTRIEQTVHSDLNIVICGETGTGKELFARLIHASERESRGPFVAVNCAAIPAELMEAELFGVERRVATGVEPRRGLFREANHGTIFLDEISEMPTNLQAKLLRVVQEREVVPIGAVRPQTIDVRVVSSTNRDLDELIKGGVFRADLLFRLRGLELNLPPLRHRKEDIPGFLLAFSSRAAHRYGKSISGISVRALEALTAFSWPGNVRELKNATELAVLLCANGGMLQLRHFERVVALETETFTAIPASEGKSGTPFLQSSLESAERSAILEALRRSSGNKSEAARLLSISRAALYLKMKRLRIPN